MNDLAEIYKAEITEQGLSALKEKYPANLVVDMTDDDEFKKARKVRTERNKLVEAINRRRIDTNTKIKNIGDNLIEAVESIYDVLVIPFEDEDKRRKKIEADKKLEQQRIADENMAQINKLRGFVDEAKRGDSAHISSVMDALTNIDCGDFHKDVIHEAMKVKESVLVELTEMLSQKIQFEQWEKEKAEMAAKIAELEEKNSDLENPQKPESEQQEDVIEKPVVHGLEFDDDEKIEMFDLMMDGGLVEMDIFKSALCKLTRG